jgi:ribosomal protein S14
MFAAEKNDDAASGRAVIRELNLARQNPALYATFVRDLRSRMSGNLLVLPGHTRIRTKEGTAAIDEAIRFLQTTPSLPPLALSRGMSRAAADHCADQADGGFGHEGKDRSHASQRIARYAGAETSQEHFQSELQLCRRRFRPARALRDDVQHGFRRRLCRARRSDSRYAGRAEFLNQPAQKAGFLIVLVLEKIDYDREQERDKKPYGRSERSGRSARSLSRIA